MELMTEIERAEIIAATEQQITGILAALEARIGRQLRYAHAAWVEVPVISDKESKYVRGFEIVMAPPDSDGADEA